MDRRTFLGSFVAASTFSPLLASAQSAPRTSISPMVVTVGHFCRDGINFRDGSCSIMRFNVSSHDPSELLEITQIAINSSPALPTMMGIGTEAHYFTLATFLGKNGYQSPYIGRHQYIENGLKHTLQGDSSLVSLLGTKLNISHQNWARTLSQFLSQGQYSIDSTTHKQVFTKSVLPPTESKMHLVSWVFLPKQMI